MYGLRWIEVDRKDRVVEKQKFFDTENALRRFMGRVEKKDNFIRFSSTTGI